MQSTQQAVRTRECIPALYTRNQGEQISLISLLSILRQPSHQTGGSLEAQHCSVIPSREQLLVHGLSYTFCYQFTYLTPCYLTVHILSILMLFRPATVVIILISAMLLYGLLYPYYHKFITMYHCNKSPKLFHTCNGSLLNHYYYSDYTDPCYYCKSFSLI